MDNAPRRRSYWQAALLGSVILQGLVGACLCTLGHRKEAAGGPRQDGPQPSRPGRLGGLPLPSGVAVGEYEAKLFAFLNTRRYAALGWPRDKRVRDTGPYLRGKYYGTHPAVRVYYSPGVLRWLEGGRAGGIPDGEMIVKEQFAAPAERHREKTEAELWASLESWTVMVKDSAGSHDGWFWSNPAKGQCVVDNHRPPFPHPVSGFGHYCVRCHASAHTPGEAPAAQANEFTFASLRNIAGFPGEPILFRVDDSWRGAGEGARPSDDRHDSHPKCVRPTSEPLPSRRADQGFLRLFPSIGRVALVDVSRLPPATHDWVVARRAGDQGFVTSNQCMGCHAGLVAPYGPSMFVPAGADVEYGARGRDVSPYGEWRWTPMGLAGRDPIFHAQLESEVQALHVEHPSDPAHAGELAATLVDACMRCHGAMGKRQLDDDSPGGAGRLSRDHVHAVAGATEHIGHGASKYGALARDGVSCAVCHRMQPRPQPPGDRRPYLQFFLESSTTGNFHLGKKGEVYGPFADDALSPYAMEHATGLKPRHSDYLKSSQLCGTCHTVVLPTVDKPLGSHAPDELTRAETVPLFKKFHHHVEQATYLEWLNSEYENEIDKQNPRAKSCQDCHMSRGVKDERHGIDVPQVRSRIAAIQDTTYPEAENLAPHDRLHVRTRNEGYRRHNFSGLNAFLLTMFDQFDDVLGVEKTDFMTGSKEGVRQAIDDMARTARDDTASVRVEAGWAGPGRLTARVVVHNKAGHRFPSGVGFRRAFLELLVVEKVGGAGTPERVVWASGRTNELGVLLGADGRPLPTESFANDPATGRQRHQGHHEVITTPDQVQVYETLLRDAKGKFTTSFVRACETVKDNRLLPRGWRREGPGPSLAGRFLQATHPDPATAKDPRYADGSGSDEVAYRIDLPGDAAPDRLEVRATLYYQAIPPYFLQALFESARPGPATRRLHHLCSHVNLEGTPVEHWKLRIGSATCGVGQKVAPQP
jgi:hypothetical protein